jgi:hypothetical protein
MSVFGPSYRRHLFDQLSKISCEVAMKAKTIGLILAIFLLIIPILACGAEDSAERPDGADSRPTATTEQTTENATPEPEEDRPTPEATRGSIIARATATPATSRECLLTNDPPFGDHLSYGDMIEVSGQASDFIANSRITYQLLNRSPLNHFYVEEVVLSHSGQFHWFNSLQMVPVDTFPRQILDLSVDMYPGGEIQRRSRPNDPELGPRWQSLNKECELVLGIFLYADPARDILLDREIIRVPLTPSNSLPTTAPSVPTAAPPVPTAAPSEPTPVPQGSSSSIDPCTSRIESDGQIEGSWISDCPSGDSTLKFAHYYRFEISRRGPGNTYAVSVQIATPSPGTSVEMTLLLGNELVLSNVLHRGSGDGTAQVGLGGLRPGTYTIAVLSSETGPYSLIFDLSPYN